MGPASLISRSSWSLALAVTVSATGQSARAQAPELLWSHDTKG